MDRIRYPCWYIFNILTNMIIVNYTNPEEAQGVKNLRDRFGSSLKVISVPRDKRYVEWTKFMLVKFLESKDEFLIKVDPDTIFNDSIQPTEECDIAGDFRKTSRWIWFGAWQFYTRKAAALLLSDPLYTGRCVHQDVALVASAHRLGLLAYNMPHDRLNAWALPEEKADVIHFGRSDIKKQSTGIIW